MKYGPEIAHGKITGITTTCLSKVAREVVSTICKQLVVHDLGVTFVESDKS